MYRLLIVEDEDIIRAGIRKIIQEMDLSIECILEAASGKEALEIAKQQNVEIIVTDIKMDNGDGLALIRNLAEAQLQSKSIILSGYGQFSYAQQAISLGVNEYLLKPIKKKKLYDALSKLINQLDSELKAAKSLPAEETSNLRQQRALLEMAQGKHAVSEIPSLLSSVDLLISSRYLATASIYAGNSTVDISNLINQITQMSHPAMTIYAACESESRYILLLLGTDDSTMVSNRQIHSILASLLTECGVEDRQALRVGISDYFEALELLPRSIEQSAYALDFRLLRPGSRHFYYRETVPLGRTSVAPNVFLQTIRNALHEGNLRVLPDALNSWFRFIQEQQEVTPSFVVDTIYNLLVYSEFISDEEQDWNSRTHSDLTRMYRNSTTLDAFNDFVKQRFTFTHTPKGPAARKVPYDSNAISFIIKYMEMHHDQDITLRSAADQIFMNPSYFSTLFKKKTGINFIHYLQKLRIEKSKELLQNPQYKIYEVATKIGFSDEKYFFKVFKNITGITPNEYRDKRDFIATRYTPSTLPKKETRD
ncbi:response regulator [Cohnella abietis]|uniref:DNA-binding response regulator n=1 Tax=Cohnella abietis TaxID=2507935 RepID=A0A3T1D081_9BACL|nr:response regulator [Cohnella abietis]BBI31502.1 hypothetical protein KCTCHS21_09010 [Cohnella abietis]